MSTDPGNLAGSADSRAKGHGASSLTRESALSHRKATQTPQEVLRRLATGDGPPYGERVPVTQQGLYEVPLRASISRENLVLLLARHQADEGLQSDLEALTNETTDDLDPL